MTPRTWYIVREGLGVRLGPGPGDPTLPRFARGRYHSVAKFLDLMYGSTRAHCLCILTLVLNGALTCMIT